MSIPSRGIQAQGKGPDVLVLHGYSAENLGDGLLVDQAVEIVREALGEGVNVTLVARNPGTFSYLHAIVIPSAPKTARDLFAYLSTLGRSNQFAIVVGVGGGYLRGGRFIESAKTAVVHLPQLIAAAKVGKRSIYLPQSIGPFRPIARFVVHRLLNKTSAVYLRDDRSMVEFPLANTIRLPDMALMMTSTIEHDLSLSSLVPILSVRHLRGNIPMPVECLANRIRPFDGFVQSRTNGNDDYEAMTSLNPRELLSQEFLLGPRSGSRIVIAVRLHAALMSVAAGHYVIHLAYERKGFGAFSDLGLGEFVHPASSFDVGVIMQQIHRLSNDRNARKEYALRVQEGYRRAHVQRVHLLTKIRQIAKTGPSDT